MFATEGCALIVCDPQRQFDLGITPDVLKSKTVRSVRQGAQKLPVSERVEKDGRVWAGTEKVRSGADINQTHLRSFSRTILEAFVDRHEMKHKAGADSRTVGWFKAFHVQRHYITVSRLL